MRLKIHFRERLSAKEISAPAYSIIEMLPSQLLPQASDTDTIITLIEIEPEHAAIQYPTG